MYTGPGYMNRNCDLKQTYYLLVQYTWKIRYKHVRVKRKKYIIENGQNDEQYTFSNDLKDTFLVTFLKRVVYVFVFTGIKQDFIFLWYNAAQRIYNAE